MDSYKKSNSQTILPTKIKASTSKVYRNLISSSELSQSDLQDLTNRICDDFGIRRVKVNYSGREPHRKTSRGTIRSKTHGTYTIGVGTIKIYKLTAARGQVRAVKATLGTLLHEICHHLDFEVLKFGESLHTSGFYKRIGHLEGQLKNT